MTDSGLESIRPSAGDLIPAPPRRVFSRLGLPIVILLATASLLAFVGWDAIRPRTEVMAVTVAIRTIETDEAPAETAAEGKAIVQAPGWVEADPFSTYASALTQGIVESIIVLEGDAVKAGQPVATLIRADSEINLRRAETEVTRRAGLLDAAQATLTAAKANYESRISVHRRVAVTEANEAKIAADLDGFPAQIAEVEANREELRDEYNRKRKLVEEGAVAAGPVARMGLRLQALNAQITQLEAERDAASASLRAAEAERIAAIADRELRIEERLDLEFAQAGVLVAEAEVGRAMADRDTAALALDRCTVVSPIDGVVIERIASPGSTIQFANGQHGAHIVHLYDPAMLQVRADIPLAEAAKVGVGQPAEIIVDLLPDTIFKGVITRFIHRADLSKNTIEAKVHIVDPSPLLKPDMLARVRILPAGNDREGALRRTVSRIFAPESAFDPQGGIWVVADRSGNEGVAARRSVEVGDARVDGWVEFRSGLRPGDTVILEPSITAGTAIRFREPNLSNGVDA